MMYKCPICDKSGLPDYSRTHTICPQCNSDLKPFFLLHTVSKTHFQKLKLFSSLGIGTLIIVLAFIYFISLNKNQKYDINESKTVQLLHDSINNLHSVIAKFEKRENADSIIIHYRVKPGDCPSRIAEFFYNNWSMYKQIEKDNNLHYPYILKIGQTLNIRLKQR